MKRIIFILIPMFIAVAANAQDMNIKAIHYASGRWEGVCPMAGGKTAYIFMEINANPSDFAVADGAVRPKYRIEVIFDHQPFGYSETYQNDVKIKAKFAFYSEGIAGWQTGAFCTFLNKPPYNEGHPIKKAVTELTIDGGSKGVSRSIAANIIEWTQLRELDRFYTDLSFFNALHRFAFLHNTGNQLVIKVQPYTITLKKSTVPHKFQNYKSITDIDEVRYVNTKDW